MMPNGALLQNPMGRRSAALLLALACLIFDWRFLAHPLSSVYGFPSADYGSTLWNFWILRENLARLQSPFSTTVLFAGQWSSLLFHTLNPLYFLATASLYLATDNVFLPFHASRLLADGLSLFCFYRLARTAGAARLLAVLGAAGLTFCAYRLQRPFALNLQSTGLLSLYAWMLLRVWRRQRVRDGVFLGMSIVAMLFSDWHGLLFSALATPFLLGWMALQFPRGRGTAGCAAAILAAVPICAAYGALAWRHAGAVEVAPYTDMMRVYWSASPLYYVTPGWLEWVWRDMVGPYTPEKVLSYKARGEWTVFIGIMPAALCLVALWLQRGRPWWGRAVLWVGAFCFFLLSLGPCLIWLHPVEGPGGNLIRLPGQWVFHLPVLTGIKHVARFGFMALFLLLLAAMGPCPKIKVPEALDPRRHWLAPAIALALLTVHSADMRPFLGEARIFRPSTEMRQALAKAGAAYPPSTAAAPQAKSAKGMAAVLPPFGIKEEGAGLYLQTLHGMTNLYGYLSRRPMGAIEQARARPFYRAMETILANPQQPAEQLPALEEKDKPAVVFVLHQSLQPETHEAFHRALAGIYAYQRIWADHQFTAYRKP